MTNKESGVARGGWLVLAGFCVFYVFLAVYTAPEYGITWDQAGQDWYCAERNLRYLLTFDDLWLDFSRKVSFGMGGTHPDVFSTNLPFVTMHFGNLISSAGCCLFFVKLGWMGSVEAHHLPNFLLMAAVLAVMFAFMRANFGVAAGLVACLAMAFQPRVWAHAHFNTKDFPFACMMVFTMLAARKGIIHRRAGWTVFASVLLGLAGSTKPNAILIPVLLALWYPALRTDSSGKTAHPVGSENKLFYAALAASPVIAMLAYYASWPYLWTDPVGIMRKYLSWYLALAGKGEGGFQWQTLGVFLAVQPPAVLLFAGLGGISAMAGIRRNNNREANAFLLLWLVLPVARVLLPGMLNYDGVRHFIEYSVPLGALTGIGVVKAVRWAAAGIGRVIPVRKPGAVFLAVVLAAAPFGEWGWKMAGIHPYEIAYYNFLVGGASGIEEICGHCGAASDYWGSSYRQGFRWLNQNAERGAIVIVPVAGYVAMAVKDMWMRPDLRLAVPPPRADGTLKEGLGQLPKAPTYAMYITRTRAYGEFARQIDFLGRTVYAITVDSHPIMKIVRLERDGRGRRRRER